jgi:hypothetical protein
MSKKQVKFIVLLTIAAFAVWTVGVILIGFVFDLGGTAATVWTVIMIIATLMLSVFKCCFDGKNSKRRKNSRKW